MTRILTPSLSEQTRIVLADPHVVVREGLRRLIESRPNCEVMLLASSGEEVLRWLRANPADLLVTELLLHGVHGLELVRRVAEEFPRLRTIVLSGSSEHHYGVRAIALGALSYLSKTCSPEELFEAMDAARAGRRYLTRLVESSLIEQLGRPVEVRPHERLSDRELQVFQLLVQGRRGREIGDQLKIAPSTVSTHVRNIQEKLGVSSVSELTRYALEHSLI